MKRTILVVFFLSALSFAQVPEPQQQFADLGQCKLASGQVIQECRIGYRTFGTLNADKSNAILVPSWYLGTSAALGPNSLTGRLFDPAKYFVVNVDALGNGVSISPSNSKSQHGSQFPKFTLRDVVETQYRLLTEKLGIKHLRAVMGASMGGMQAFVWAVAYPDFMDKVIPVAGTPRPSYYDRMLWITTRDSITRDPDFQNGNYTKNPDLPVTNYLMALHLSSPNYFRVTFEAQEFEKFRAKIVSDGQRFDANDRLSQLEAMITHDIGAAFGGSLDKAAAAIRARVFIVVSRQDALVTPHPAIEFGHVLRAPVYVIDSDCGHLATGCEVGRVTEAIRTFLAQP